ncbi:MAG: hypothetical protein CVV37_07380 [Nitrospira bacterium HGW-Nitrospira-1]|nr:MAG: hypothetical protein CVV37_07380 [Nitrospira bacterium HGW-Nitrospira-1]
MEIPDSKRLPFAVFCLGLFLIIFAQSLEAETWTKKLETQYTVIYYSNENDLDAFVGKAGNIDRIVNRVEGLLDMYPADLHFNIYIYQTYRETEAIYRTMGELDRAPIAFYSHKTKTVYISLETITDGVLAHEAAHVVINFYFVTPPPVRMQEILAQYVDRHLREK